jgi:hypothetical protein
MTRVFEFALSKEASLPRDFSLPEVFFCSQQSLLCLEFVIWLSTKKRTLGKACDSGSVRCNDIIREGFGKNLRRFQTFYHMRYLEIETSHK